MLDIADRHGVTVPVSMFNLSGLVQVQDQDPMTFTNFLEKFKTLRLFYKSPDVIHRVTQEAIEDAARDNIRYMELRFTPVALSRAEGFPLHDVMDWVATSASESARKHNIKVGLIASVRVRLIRPAIRQCNRRNCHPMHRKFSLTFLSPTGC